MSSATGRVELRPTGTSRSAVPLTQLRLARAGGSSDWLRITLTVIGAGLSTASLVAAAAVAGMTGPLESTVQVLAQPGLRFGVVVTLLLLSLPCLVFAGMSARVGTPARDRRLTALRLAGATPWQARGVALWEVATASILGTVLGVMGLAAAVEAAGSRLVNLHEGTVWEQLGSVRVVVLAAVAAASVPALAVGFTVLASRRVTLSPFGSLRRSRRRPPAVLPAVAFVGGVAGLAAFSTYGASVGRSSGVLIAGLLLLLTLFGLLVGSATLTYLIGLGVTRVARRPALLVAGHRMVAAPFTSSRATASVLLGVLLGSIVMAFKANFLALTDPTDRFYAQTFRMIEVVLVVGIGLAAATLLVVQAEGLVARRRSLASLVAAGTPRWVLARATLAETLLPIVPCVLLAAAAGLGAGLGSLGRSGYTYYSSDTNAPVIVLVPIPWLDVAVLVAGSIGAVLVMTAASLVMLWPSTRPAELRTAA